MAQTLTTTHERPWGGEGRSEVLDLERVFAGCFCFRVVSVKHLSGDGLRVGDFVICTDKKQPTEGSLAVLSVDKSGPMLRRWFVKGGHLRLPGYDWVVPRERVRLLGAVVGMVRVEEKP